MVQEFSDLKAIKYDSIMDICLSDHKPVYAIFEIKLYDGKGANPKDSLPKKRHTIDIPGGRQFQSNRGNSKACLIF
jgi:hypothetical protein